MLVQQRHVSVSCVGAQDSGQTEQRQKVFVRRLKRALCSLRGGRRQRRACAHLPIFRLPNGRVYWPMKSLSDAASWSSTTKRTSASSGTYTSNWKFSFQDGFKPPNTKGRKVDSTQPSPPGGRGLRIKVRSLGRYRC